MTADEVQVDVFVCARCGGDHDSLTFLKLLRPTVLDGETLATHYSICPANGQPILMRVTG